MINFGLTEEDSNDLGELWRQCGLNTKRRVKGDEMRDLEERIDRIENRLSGFKIIDELCPKCETFMPMIEVTGNNHIIRCLGCLQRLVHIDRYEIAEA